MSAWAAPYVGIPFRHLGRGHDGCDCWGLVCLVYREQFGIDLPSYDGAYASAADKTEVARLIAGGQCDWARVDPPLAQPGDVGLFRYADGTPGHVGIMLGPRRLLHCHEGLDTTVADLDRRTLGLRWRDRLDMIGRYVR